MVKSHKNLKNDTVVPFLGTYLKEIIRYVRNDLCTRIFTKALKLKQQKHFNVQDYETQWIMVHPNGRL